jgi:hypothetical protein
MTSGPGSSVFISDDPDSLVVFRGRGSECYWFPFGQGILPVVIQVF